jgi:hypothetical protein
MGGRAELPSNHFSGTTSEVFKAPNHFLAITDIPGYGILRSVYDGKSAWTEDPKQGIREMSGPPSRICVGVRTSGGI